MSPKVLLLNTIYISLFVVVTCDFTFKNVVVTCESEDLSDEEVPFGTYVTTNRLQPHLPSDQSCYKIAIQHEKIPVLHRDSLSDIRNAHFLILDNNEIEAIEPRAFQNVAIKEAISLKSNKIREIRRGVFNGVKVPVLLLSFNIISYIDYAAFDNMTALESIHLDHNELNRIDIFWFKNTPKLTQLFLQHNLIEEVPANAFRNLVTGKTEPLRIDLSHNLISFVHGNAFLKARKLSYLSLAYNRLKSLDRNWLKGVKVNTLDISNNDFQCLSYGLAASESTNLIDRNPWKCQCLQEIKMKENTIFGRIVAEEALKQCNIVSRNFLK